jgi:inhibitor of KinA
MRFTPLGDQAITITLGDSIDEPTRRRVHAATSRIERAALPGIVDLVPGFASVTLHYDPAAVPAEASYEFLVERLTPLLASTSDDTPPSARVIEIPVCYGGDLGPDLGDVAARHEMSEDEVIALHSAGDYVVYMVGFMPGFAYLGGLADRLVTPRRSTPRKAVPAGAVGIGGAQTGVYPMISPGGWNLIGQTPRVVFDPTRAEPSLFATGDHVRFRAITRGEFDTWRE